MLLTLLLQKTVSVEIASLTNVYLALGGTLMAALIAAAASFVASSKADKTSEKVVALTTKTNHEVAALSAQVTRESATLAARTAQELKEKDYKHDFYKKIIARRLAAWEVVEQFMSQISNAMQDDDDGKNFFNYCQGSKIFDDTMDKMRGILVSQVFWIGSGYSSNFTLIYNELLAIRRESSHNIPGATLSTIDDNLLLHSGKKHYSECASITNELLKTMATQLSELHDVELFLKQAEHIDVGVEL